MDIYYNFKDDRRLDRDELKTELNVSFPVGTEQVGDDWHLVHFDRQKEPTPFGQRVRHDGYELVDGICYNNLVFEDMTLEEVRGKVRIASMNQFVQASAMLDYEYTESERATFPQQLAEAKAYLEDIGSPVPFLMGIAEERGMSVTDVAKGIIENANLRANRYGRLIGKYHKLSRQIEDAVTVEELRVINDEIATLN